MKFIHTKKLTLFVHIFFITCLYNQTWSCENTQTNLTHYLDAAMFSSAHMLFYTQ
jgi:hypothetical protein